MGHLSPWDGIARTFVSPASRLSSSLAFDFQLETSAAKTWHVSCLVRTGGSLRNLSVENTEIFNAFVKVRVSERCSSVLSFFCTYWYYGLLGCIFTFRLGLRMELGVFLSTTVHDFTYQETVILKCVWFCYVLMNKLYCQYLDFQIRFMEQPFL
jgi:hypothetical protein